MQDFSYEEINNMSEETAKQVLRDEMLDRANKRAEEERRKEESKDSLDRFFNQKKESGLLTPYKTL
ncbi:MULTISPECIES: hypothetical protein [Parabacteroides]|uniref:hypothetical protein n=1 Tax=Parabacteroides TaxID=375288 RepID=UPI0001B29039|nr:MULTISPECIES: hypothetical protein [Parabacteroides]EEU53375.1 hypothetical protein HMPREF0619_00947 [Parabacteroides sp. D13]MBM6557616.1 hypothetical protein [Parabacteroides distasonis]